MDGDSALKTDGSSDTVGFEHSALRETQEEVPVRVGHSPPIHGLSGEEYLLLGVLESNP